MKHAYLIMAHDNLAVLNILLKMIDDERNDIYIHLDRKSRLDYHDLYIPIKARFFYIEKRIDVIWGDYSQIKLELMLLENAFNNGPYLYYHLISGSDLPIKSQDYIHKFFSENYDKEFIGFAQGEYNQLDCKKKVGQYHLFTRWNKTQKPIKKIIRKIIKKPLEKLLNTILKRPNDIIFKKGANWISITNACCSFILSKKEYINKRFKYTLCADEIFVQTLIYNSPFYSKCYNTSDEYTGCQRKIDWKRGNPYIWKEEDIDELICSKKIFARKIRDEKIATKLYNIIKKIQ